MYGTCWEGRPAQLSWRPTPLLPKNKENLSKSWASRSGNGSERYLWIRPDGNGSDPVWSGSTTLIKTKQLKIVPRVGLLYGSPGFESRPALLPWFSPGKSRSRKVSEQIFPRAAAGDSSAAAGVSAHHQGWILYQYCSQKITKINKKSAGKGTKNLNFYIVPQSDRLIPDTVWTKNEEQGQQKTFFFKKKHYCILVSFVQKQSTELPKYCRSGRIRNFWSDPEPNKRFGSEFINFF
jgi:hypothetical protein